MNSKFMGGVADACGFIGGALGGFYLGKTFDFDVFAPGYGASSMLGIALCGLGGGLGLQLMRWVYAKATQNKS